MEIVIRLLPDADADGASNMAADEVMVRSAARGVASLRFYGWTTATTSLGYFQPAAVRLTNAHLQALPWVRRPSGGATLVHHHELTYALALSHGSPWHSHTSWMPRMHRIITLALTELGLGDQIETVAEHPVKHGDVLCFQQHTTGDLLCQGKKVVGSAQRKYHQALLQHGSILLAQSEYTPVLSGIRDLTGVDLSVTATREAVWRAFARETGWHGEQKDWTEEERGMLAQLVNEKYSRSSWNEKR